MDKAVVDAYFRHVDGIKNPAVRDAVRTIATKIVDPRFWTAPASSSGKYHPSWQNDPSGLVRHTVEMAAMAPRLVEMLDELLVPSVAHNTDLVVAAILLHDAFKGGRPWADHTDPKHAEISAGVWDQVSEVVGVAPRDAEIVIDAITFHEGRWTKTAKTSFRSLRPHAKVVHIADMVSSAKQLERVFEPRAVPA